MKKSFFLFFLLIPFLALSQEGFNKQRLNDYLDLLESYNKANLTVAISKGNQLIYEKHAGHLSSAKSQRINADTKFKIGSITKTFTAVVVFQLIEEGKLTLETKLNSFYPDFPNGDKITIAHLLSHQSGIHNFTDEPDFVSYAAQKKTKPELLEIMKRMSSDFEPGTNTSYSNSGYIMLGLIVEKITSQTYTDNIRTRIIDKLNLKNTGYGDKIEHEKNEATSMIFQGGSWITYPLEWHMSVPYSAGAIVSTPSSLNKFMYGLFNYKLVSKASVDKMKEVVRGLGHGIFAVPFYQRRGFGHNGHIESFDSGSYYFEEDDINVTVLSSGLTMTYNNILIGVLSILFDKPFEFPNYDAKPIKLSAEQLPAYEGNYSSSTFPLKITVKANGDQLTAQATGQGAFPLTPYSNTEFRFDGAGIVMLFGNKDGDQYKSFTLKQGGQQYEFKKD